MSIQKQRPDEYNVTSHWHVLRDLVQSGRIEEQIDGTWTYASFFKSIRGFSAVRTPIWKGTPVLFGKDLRPLIGIVGTMVGIDNESTASGACEWCITAAEPNSNRQPTYPGCFSVPQDRHADTEDNNAIWLCRGACMNCFVRGQPCTSQSGRRPIGTPQLQQGEVFRPRFQANRSGSSAPSSQESFLHHRCRTSPCLAAVLKRFDSQITITPRCLKPSVQPWQPSSPCRLLSLHRRF